MISQPVLKVLPQRTVACLRKEIPCFNYQILIWDELKSEMKKLKIKKAPTPLALSVFYNAQKPLLEAMRGIALDMCDVEIQCNVAGSYEDTELIKFKTVKQTQIVSITFVGEYEQLAQVSDRFAEYEIHNNCKLDYPIYCILHVSPNDVLDSEKWVTEICCTIK